MAWWAVVLIVIGVILFATFVYDLVQRRHAILRNFPVVGHLRYALETIGPELRQYIVTDNNEERPFSRDQRRWVYASAKKENPYFGFGTDDDIDRPGHIIIKHAAFPESRESHNVPLPSAKVMGEWRGRRQAFRPESLVNISAMSFGSLSGRAIEALNKGAAIAGCWHNTGEGGVSKHHRQGGDLVFQLGTAYFGARNSDGSFCLDKLVDNVESAPVKAVEIKLSQGAKPGLGGLLPGAKVNAEIAEARDVEIGQTVASPACHTAFDGVPSMVEFIETVADATGKPVGIKSAVGQMSFWEELAEHMSESGRGPDFITIDGGEGGTGAAPLVFANHVAFPFQTAMANVFGVFAAADLHQKVTFVGSGKLGFPGNAIAAMALGCDVVNVGREAMLALGCIQAQKCHTDHCPVGVATQNKRLVRGLDPASKSVRTANYIDSLRGDMLRVSFAGGAVHPALLPMSAVDIIDTNRAAVPITSHFGLKPQLHRLSDNDIQTINAIMNEVAPAPGGA
ncbi:MAG: FMN-binding glutamate synthase family protein [Acidimicrobiales bacterium]